MASAKTKNQNNTTTDPIAEAEAALAAARGLLVQRQEEAEQAREFLADLRERLGWGDDSVQVDDMVRAQFGVEKAEGLIKAAQRDVQAAERALSKALAEHEATVAEWVADAIKANAWSWGLYGVPVHVGKPSKDAPEPSVWLSQEAATEAVVGRTVKVPTGPVSATVNLVVVTPGGEPIGDAGPIMTAARNLAEQAGGEVSTSAGNHPQGSTVRLSFRNVIAGLPVLSEKLRDAKAAHAALLGAVIEAGPQEFRRVREVGPQELVPVISGRVDSAELVDSLKDGRLVTRSFEGTIRLTSAAPDVIDQAVEKVVGLDTIAGRVLGAKVIGREVREIERNRRPTTETVLRVLIGTRFRLVR